jgi:drug/metabolite transporter (DMT)-like permease
MAIANNFSPRTAPLFALGFAFGMPLAGMVFAGRLRKGGLNLKSPGAAILLFLLMGVACYGCAGAATNHNYGTLSGTYALTVRPTAER